MGQEGAAKNFKPGNGQIRLERAPSKGSSSQHGGRDLTILRQESGSSSGHAPQLCDKDSAKPRGLACQKPVPTFETTHPCHQSVQFQNSLPNGREPTSSTCLGLSRVSPPKGRPQTQVQEAANAGLFAECEQAGAATHVWVRARVGHEPEASIFSLAPSPLDVTV